jgi:hypothetical protein
MSGRFRRHRLSWKAHRRRSARTRPDRACRRPPFDERRRGGPRSPDTGAGRSARPWFSEGCARRPRCRGQRRLALSPIRRRDLSRDPRRGRRSAGAGRGRGWGSPPGAYLGIGADARSTAPYIRARGQGEDAVRLGFLGATILRPSVMFGPNDALLTTLIGLVRRLPIVPLFGDGGTRLQPVHVEDIAAAVASLVAASDPPGPAMSSAARGLQLPRAARACNASSRSSPRAAASSIPALGCACRGLSPIPACRARARSGSARRRSRPSFVGA